MPVYLKQPDGTMRRMDTAPPKPVHIDRHTTAKILGATIRTLQRWHEDGFGPPCRNNPGERPIWYDRAEVEQWAASNGYPK